jgi:hypothetical protein
VHPGPKFRVKIGVLYQQQGEEAETLLQVKSITHDPYQTWSDTWSYTDPNEFEMFKGTCKEYEK